MQIYLARNGQQAGPYSLEQLNQMLQDQQVLLTDLIWHQGLTEWKPLGELTRGQFNYQPNGYAPPHHQPTSPTTTSEKNTTSELASLSSRALAKLIDLIIWLPSAVFLTYFLTEDGIKKIEALNGSISRTAQEQFMQTIPSQAWFAMAVYIIIMLVIQAFLLNKYGQSIGKIITKVQIVDQQSQARVPLTRIFLIRSVIFIIFNLLSSPLMSIIDYAFGMTKNRQTLHDRLAKTKVIKKNKK